VATWNTVGLTDGFTGTWLSAWLRSWAVAFSAVMVVAPLVCWFVARVVVTKD